jgi:hypothetical protein
MAVKVMAGCLQIAQHAVTSRQSVSISNFTDIFALQEEIPKSAAAALKLSCFARN